MRLVTLSSRPGTPLEDSCARLGVPLTVLRRPYPAHGAKVLYLREFLDELPSDELVCYCDAYDALWVRDPHGFEADFVSLGFPVVFSCEQYFCHKAWDKLAVRWRYPPARGRWRGYRYLNAGAFAGYAGALGEALARLRLEADSPCDQTPMNRLLLRDCGLDYDQVLFGGTGGREGWEEQDFSFAEGGVRHGLTGTRPYLLHFPGRNVVGMNLVRRRLGWEEGAESVQDRIRYRHDRRRNRLARMLRQDRYGLELLEKGVTAAALLLLLRTLR